MFDVSVFYIIFWMTTSCTMIIFNKAVLSSMDFPFPMFITTWHMLFATVLTQVLSRTTDMLPGVKEKKVDRTVMIYQIIPVSLCFAASLVLSNNVYLYLSVSFIQMLKAFTPVAVLILSVITGLETASYIEINIILIICVGVALTSVGELQFSMTGFIYQALAIVFECGRLVLTNIFLKKLGLDSLSTLYYIAPVCGFVIGCACFAFEFHSLPYDLLSSLSFWGILVANGLVAFTLNVASVMLIKHTSALTLTLAGVIKDILLVFLSLMIFKSPVTALQYLGYSVSLLALNLHKEYKKNASLFETNTAINKISTTDATTCNSHTATNGASNGHNTIEMTKTAPECALLVDSSSEDEEGREDQGLLSASRV